MRRNCTGPWPSALRIPLPLAPAVADHELRAPAGFTDSRRIRKSSPPGLRRFAQIRDGFAK
eukprot:1710095-Prymnesium_polylepis.1